MTKEFEELANKHERDLELTVLGMSDIEIARRVKTGRQTVNEWRNHDIDFIDTLSLCRQAIRPDCWSETYDI